MSLLQVSGCLSCGHEASLDLLLPHLAQVVVEAAEVAGGRVRIWARVRAAGAPCPHCGQFAERVHSAYERRLADAPVGGQPVTIRLAVRRFFCGNPDCSAVTFAEQVKGLTARCQRRTPPLARTLAVIALALAGRAGSRLAAGARPVGGQVEHAAAGHGAARPGSQNREGPGSRPIRGPQPPVRNVASVGQDDRFLTSACRYPRSHTNVGDVGMMSGHGGAACPA